MLTHLVNIAEINYIRYKIQLKTISIAQSDINWTILAQIVKSTWGLRGVFTCSSLIKVHTKVLFHNMHNPACQCIGDQLGKPISNNSVVLRRQWGDGLLKQHGHAFSTIILLPSKVFTSLTSPNTRGKRVIPNLWESDHVSILSSTIFNNYSWRILQPNGVVHDLKPRGIIKFDTLPAKARRT